ncbi:hypothetical protein [Phenylobacterium sp.]|nr:hypothetical protein [Phenylobacterium sp.]MDP3660790.1 hypothetical protein [Phenylobacterium sp.]
MTDKPPEDEPGADERFKRGIANALRTPPKPHKPKEGREPKPAPKGN